MTLEPSTHTWVLFVASRDSHLLQQIAQRQSGRVSRYRIENVTPVTGTAPADLASGWSLLRFESEAPIQPADESLPGSQVPLTIFRGVTQHLHYTSDVQRQELEERSRAELEPSPETTAVLIPIGKSPDWWQLAQDRRQAHFQTGGQHPGHTAIGIRYVDRVFRKLYHSRYIGSPTPVTF